MTTFQRLPDVPPEPPRSVVLEWGDFIAGTLTDEYWDDWLVHYALRDAANGTLLAHFCTERGARAYAANQRWRIVDAKVSDPDFIDRDDNNDPAFPF